MVIYDHVGIPEVVFLALRERIQIDRLWFEEGCEEQAILREKCPLTVYLQMKV